MHLPTLLLSLLALTSTTKADMLFWQAEWLTIVPGLPPHYYTNHYTIAGISGQTACDAYGSGGTQATASSAYEWITNDNYCGRTWKVRGAEFWVVRTSSYAQTCTPAAIQQKLPYALMFDMGGTYQGWCQGMGNDFTSKYCGAAASVMDRKFKFVCYTKWFTKRDGENVKGRELEAPVPPAEYNITIPASIPMPPGPEWL